MSRLESLLTQDEPLEQHEIRDLQDWLEILQADCETFGETSEDRQRMARIKAAIARPRP